MTRVMYVLKDISVNLVQIALQVDLLSALPVPPYQPGQDCHVGTEEGETLQPDEEEGVVSLELKQVCW